MSAKTFFTIFVFTCLCMVLVVILHQTIRADHEDELLRDMFRQFPDISWVHSEGLATASAIDCRRI